MPRKPLEELVIAEVLRQDKARIREKLSREYINSHPELKENPDSVIEDIPEGASEDQIRTIARRMKIEKEARKIRAMRLKDD